MPGFWAPEPYGSPEQALAAALEAHGTLDADEVLDDVKIARFPEVLGNDTPDDRVLAGTYRWELAVSRPIRLLYGPQPERTIVTDQSAAVARRRREEVLRIILAYRACIDADVASEGA